MLDDIGSVRMFLGLRGPTALRRSATGSPSLGFDQTRIDAARSAGIVA
jgi:hypothetical protein